ncbi:MAG: SDR family oxidoreductase [Actinobacteria bacterium]|nr:SDR family oxidoreductase [Actinomycetota bacterium]
MQSAGSRRRLEGKSAIVTGGGGGLGEAGAVAIALEGAAVAVLDLDGGLADATAARIVDEGGRAIGLRCDVTEPEEVEAAFDAAAAEFGLANVLFNNAGVTGPMVKAPDTPLDQWNACVAVNLTGVFIVAREFLRRALAAKSPGSIVNTASIDGLYAEEGGPAYIATKGAVVALSRALALDHAREGIRVNALCPGHVLSPMTAPLYEGHDAYREAVEKAHAVGRIGTPEEIAQVVVFLASDESSFVTGHPLVADGGFSVGWSFRP